MWEKLKSFLRDDALFYTVLLLLVAVISFGLGRSAGMNESSGQGESRNKAAIEILEPNTESEESLPNSTSGEVVASKSGSKYHLPSCPGASQIKPENIVRFSSAAAATAAGYTPAANCSF